MAMTLGGNGSPKAQINMTPMIDVLLVLIIIFMIITPLAPTGLNALVPQPAPADREQPAEAHDIVLTVQGDGTVRINQEPVELSRLADRLRLLFAAGCRQVVFVRAEKDMEFRLVAEVIDIAKGAGVDRIGLMTQ